MKKCTLDRAHMEILDGSGTAEEYRRILDFALRYADCFSLTYHPFMENPGLTVDDFRRTKWGFLADSIVDCEVTKETPTTVSEAEKLMLYFRFDPVTIGFLRQKTSIYDFRDHMTAGEGFLYFEDLAFLKDGQVFFASCSHEEFYLVNETLYQKG